MKSSKRPRVLLVQKYVPEYRVAFFNKLRMRLAENGIDLDLVYGDPSAAESQKRDAVRLDWASYARSISLQFGQRRLLYQPILITSRHYDLVIVEQAAKLLVNIPLVALNQLGIRKVAFWGAWKGLSEDVVICGFPPERFLSRRVAWWFAYNELSATVVRNLGFPDQRITRVMNTIDNAKLQQQISSIDTDELSALQDAHQLSNNTCIYVGGMYQEKRLQFLLDACEIIRREIPDFHLILLGSGSDEERVRQFALTHSWCLWKGAKFGREKALYLRAAKLMLIPGLVGLAIIDSFVAGLPIITTSIPYHSPEIEYLHSEENGIIVDSQFDTSIYAQTVISLLQDENRLEEMRKQCAKAAAQYTMDNMVNNFSIGIYHALGELVPSYRPLDDASRNKPIDIASDAQQT